MQRHVLAEEKRADLFLLLPVLLNTIFFQRMDFLFI